MTNLIIHVYFGDHHKHPIINNYLNIVSHNQLVVDSPKSNKGRLSRMCHLARLLFANRKNKKAVFHTHDLLSFYLVKIMLPTRPILFDSHEIYKSYFSGPLYYLVSVFEELSTLICSYKFLPSLERRGLYKINKNILVVENLFVPKRLPSNIDKKKNSFVYGGLLSDQRCIDEMVQVFKKMPSCFLTIYGGKTPYMESVLDKGLPENVSYRGEITQDELVNELPKHAAAFALYKPIDLNNQYPAPTKLFENEYLGIPTIVFSSEYVNRLISTGVLVNTFTLDSLQENSVKKILANPEIHNCQPNPSKRIIWESQVHLIEKVYSGMFLGL